MIGNEVIACIANGQWITNSRPTTSGPSDILNPWSVEPVSPPEEQAGLRSGLEWIDSRQSLDHGCLWRPLDRSQQWRLAMVGGNGGSRWSTAMAAHVGSLQPLAACCILIQHLICISLTVRIRWRGTIPDPLEDGRCERLAPEPPLRPLLLLLLLLLLLPPRRRCWCCSNSHCRVCFCRRCYSWCTEQLRSEADRSCASLGCNRMGFVTAFRVLHRKITGAMYGTLRELGCLPAPLVSCPFRHATECPFFYSVAIYVVWPASTQCWSFHPAACIAFSTGLVSAFHL